MINPNNPTARRSGIVVQEMPGEVLIYDMEHNKAHCLNESAALVWKNCNGQNSVSDIVKTFEATGNGKVSEDFVWLAIDQLRENGLMADELPQRFAGRSRREVLKTIGLGAMVALPVVASLVAPKNALASVSCVCQVPANCLTLVCPSTSNCNQNGICAPDVAPRKS